MDCSIIIPTRNRPVRLASCLAALARQHRSGVRFEVLVAVDGPERGERDVAERSGLDPRLVETGGGGPAVARNAALECARAPVTLLLNDDVVANPDLICHHVEAQQALIDAGRTAMVLGASPWVVPEPDCLFDRLIRETSMVFFYDQMVGASAEDPDHDWGFRHAWTLNLSVPTAALRVINGFCTALPGAAYEDIELAWRLRERCDAPVLYRPQAVAWHDHRYEPLGYLDRERRLGRWAWALAEANPACARAVFGRDITDPAEVARAEAAAADAGPEMDELERRFCALTERPSSEVAGAAETRRLWEQFRPLKRHHWRLGYLDGPGRRKVA